MQYLVALCFCLTTWLAGLLVLSVQSATAQSWQAFPNCPSCTLEHPLVFISSKRISSLSNGGSYGTDVLDVSATHRGHKLEILLTNGQVKTLFPIQGVHTPPLIDFPAWPPVVSAGDPAEYNQMINGSVVEPSISIDGEWVYFSYFHDLVNKPCNAGSSTHHSDFRGWPSDADIYAIHLKDILTDPNTNPATLPVVRLTQTNDKYAHAMNALAAEHTGFCKHTDPGVYNLAPIEMDTRTGRKLVFVSNQKRLDISNRGQSFRNLNFNLHEADLIRSPTRSIENVRQFQYYTTSSALSPVQIRNGLAFSYQANTEDPRNWDMQQIDSEGRWGPLYGYGDATNLAHLGTFCVKTNGGTHSSGDYFVSTSYYNQNNNGFGLLRAQNLSSAGLNSYTNTKGAGRFVPTQIGSYTQTIGVKSGDYPSQHGKFSTPACGGPDMLFSAYSPTPSNSKYPNTDTYTSQIVLSDLNPINLENTHSGMTTVLKDASNSFAAIWPKPVVDWNYRLSGLPHPQGAASQEIAEPIASPDSPISAGLPYAEIGSSALYNTDITGPACKYPNMPHFNPHEVQGDNDFDLIKNNVDSLTWIADDTPSNPAITDAEGNWTGTCAKPLPSHVLGIAIYLSSNKISNETNGPIANWNKPGYKTDGNVGHAKEAKQLLGVYDVRAQSDTSFKALLPANVPVDFQLIQADYGLKLADVRSWHSLKPREDRHDCGGCHNHKPGEAVEWEGTYAAEAQSAPLDMVNQTKRITYNESCSPTLVTDLTPASQIPVWQDLSAGFDQHCGSCHRNDSGNSTALLALSYSETDLNAADSGLVSEMVNKHYLSRDLGALSSPAFWAAYGKRTDGRSNNHPDYQANHPSYSGFEFSTVHASIGPRSSGLCDGDPSNGPIAEWVYKFGLWIDNHMPVDVEGNTYQYSYDRYHPTIDGALTDASCSTNQIHIGYWDESGRIDRLEVTRNGTPYLVLNHSLPATDLSNGSRLLDISTFNATDSIQVKAVDYAGNMQEYSKSLEQLVIECQSNSGSNNLNQGSPPSIEAVSPNPAIFNENLQLQADGLYHLTIHGSHFAPTNNTIVHLTILPAGPSLEWQDFTVLDESEIILKLPHSSEPQEFLLSVSSLVGGTILSSEPVELNTSSGSSPPNTSEQGDEGSSSDSHNSPDAQGPDDSGEQQESIKQELLVQVKMIRKLLKKLRPTLNKKKATALRKLLKSQLKLVLANISQLSADDIHPTSTLSEFELTSLGAKKASMKAIKASKRSYQVSTLKLRKKKARKAWKKALAMIQ